MKKGLLLLTLLLFVGCSEKKISYSDYMKVKEGMTYEQVSKILGTKGEVQVESSLVDVETVSYGYEGRGRQKSHASLIFQNNKLLFKAQYGLE